MKMSRWIGIFINVGRGVGASFLALGVAFDELLWSERLLVLPGILLLRVLVADLLAQLFKPANKYMPWMV